MPNPALGTRLFCEQTIKALAVGEDTLMGETVTRQGRAGAGDGKGKLLQAGKGKLLQAAKVKPRGGGWGGGAGGW